MDLPHTLILSLFFRVEQKTGFTDRFKYLHILLDAGKYDLVS